MEWLEKTFGDDCVHARADRNEKTYHIHAVILPRAVTKDGRKMLQPSTHTAIRYYEKAQDDVGAWFAAADIGLRRGERRKKKVRAAIRHNKKLRAEQQEGRRLGEAETPLPEYRQHVSPRKWREAQECKLVEREADVQGREEKLAETEAAVTDREQAASGKQREAEEVLAVAQAVADGDLGGLECDQAPDSAQEPAPGKPALARRLFASAVARLKKTEQAAARTELKAAFDEVRRADDAIVRIANLLPMDLRKQIASVRKSLTHSLMALPSQIRGDRGAEHDEPPRV